MLFFYAFMIGLYLVAMCILIYNTREKSQSYLTYLTINRQKLLKKILNEYLFFHNSHIAISIVIQAYITWCGIGILKQFGIYKFDTCIGIYLISIVILLLLIKRLLIHTVAKKSVLYL